MMTTASMVETMIRHLVKQARVQYDPKQGAAMVQAALSVYTDAVEFDIFEADECQDMLEAACMEHGIVALIPTKRTT